MTHHPLDWSQAVAALRGLEGREVAVRVVRPHHGEELIAVFHGQLGRLTAEAKQPSLFWPLDGSEGPAERPGLYLREQDFERAELRAGGIVVVRQAGVVLNVRALELLVTSCKGCGAEFSAGTEDELVAQVQAHVSEAHAHGHVPTTEQVRAVIRKRMRRSTD